MRLALRAQWNMLPSGIIGSTEQVAFHGAGAKDAKKGQRGGMARRAEVIQSHEDRYALTP